MTIVKVGDIFESYEYYSTTGGFDTGITNKYLIIDANDQYGIKCKVIKSDIKFIGLKLGEITTRPYVFFTQHNVRKINKCELCQTK